MGVRISKCLGSFLTIFVLGFVYMFASSGWILYAASNWNLQTVDNKALLRGISIAIDSNDKPHLCYSDSITGVYQNSSDIYVTYASYNGSGWTTQTIAPGEAGDYSLALDSKDNPHIVFDENDSLMYAAWNGTNWNIQNIDSTGAGRWGIGSEASIALDSHGFPHILYSGAIVYPWKSVDFKYASWNGTSWVIQTVDSETGSLEFSQYLAIDSKDQPSVLYGYGEENWTVKYATQNLSGNWSIQTVLSNAAVSSLGNVALDSSGYPSFTYYLGGALIYASWNGSAWSMQTVDSHAGNVESGSSLCIGAGNVPSIGYFSSSQGNSLWPVPVMYAKLTDETWSIQNVVNGTIADEAIRLVLDSSGDPHIVYLTLRDDNDFYIDGTAMYATSNQSNPDTTPTETQTLTHTLTTQSSPANSATPNAGNPNWWQSDVAWIISLMVIIVAACAVLAFVWRKRRK
jgi:hypothetical protein